MTTGTECFNCRHEVDAHANGPFLGCAVDGCSCFMFSALRNADGSIDAEDRPAPTCPACGHADETLAAVIARGDLVASPTHVRCSSCMADYRLVVHVERLYTSDAGLKADDITPEETT